MVRDWLPLFAVLFAYDLLRGLAPDIGARLAHLPTLQADLKNPAFTEQAHLSEPINGDKLLFGGHVPTVWLQDHLYTPGHVHWYDALAVPVYFSHFFVSLGVAVLLWALSYRLFRRYVWTLVTLTVVTLATYALFPAAPPWMAGLPANHALPEVYRVVPDTLRQLGGHTVNSAVERGAAYSNRVAAMPSLHGAIPLMLLLFAWPLVRRRWRGPAVGVRHRDVPDAGVRRRALRHRHLRGLRVRRSSGVGCRLVVPPTRDRTGVSSRRVRRGCLSDWC